MDEHMLNKVSNDEGFIAALDQSGGSTPKALKLYGVAEDAYSGDDEMFDLIHQMRSRIITSSSFDGARVLGAILFEQTMDREVEGRGTADYLWNVKRVVPFLKVDKGLADEVERHPGHEAHARAWTASARRRSARACSAPRCARSSRSPTPTGITANVAQQFEIGRQILGHGLVPIIEPEVDINSPSKAEAESLLKERLLAEVAGLQDGQQIMLKLTLPEADGFYAELVQHPAVLRVVALSGGYARQEANARLSRNPGVIASFSRALTEGLSAQQSDAEFDAALDASIQSIFEASRT